MGMKALAISILENWINLSTNPNSTPAKAKWQIIPKEFCENNRFFYEIVYLYSGATGVGVNSFFADYRCSEESILRKIANDHRTDYQNIKLLHITELELKG